MVKPTVNNPAGRIPPQSIQAEQAVLCSCLDSESAMTVALTVLVPADFYHPGHRLIFTAILELSALRNAVDIITVSEHLAKKGELEAVGGTAYISQLSDLMIIRSNVSDYAAIVRQKSMLRRLITSLDEVMKLSFEGEQEANNLVDIAIKRLSDMREAPTGAGFESVNEILKELYRIFWISVKGKKSERLSIPDFRSLTKPQADFVRDHLSSLRRVLRWVNPHWW